MNKHAQLNYNLGKSLAKLSKQASIAEALSNTMAAAKGGITNVANKGVDAASKAYNAAKNAPQGAVLGGAVGAGVGGVAGAALSKEHKLRNALLGILGGGALGAGAGHVINSKPTPAAPSENPGQSAEVAQLLASLGVK